MDTSQSHFVLNSEKVKAVDEHLERRKEHPEPPPDDALVQAQKLYKHAQKLYERLIHSAITVFDSRTFTLEDLLIRDPVELSVVINRRLDLYNQQIKTAKRIYKTLVR